MGDYFRSRRRKLGVLLLGIACLLTSAWIRSFRHEDAYLYPSGDFTTNSFYSSRGSVFWRHDDESVWDIRRDQRDYGFHSRQFVGADSGLLFSEVQNWRWAWRLAGCGVAAGEDSSGGYARIWTLPYAMITLPLTLASTYLLLGRFRRRTVTSEPPM